MRAPLLRKANSLRRERMASGSNETFLAKIVSSNRKRTWRDTHMADAQATIEVMGGAEDRDICVYLLLKQHPPALPP